MGIEVKIERRASLKPKYRARRMESRMVKREIRTMAMFMPRSCCRCVGSLARREVRAPTELEGSSW